jgi:hypothetical protein
VKKANKKGKSKEKKELYAYYVELESPLDLARQAFGYTAGHIKAMKNKDKYVLMTPGERIGELRLIYYTQVDAIGNFFVYNPGSDSLERFEIKDRIISDHTDYKSYKAPIVEMLTTPYSELKDMKKGGKVTKIEIKNSDALIKSLASYAQEDDPLPKLYAFFDGKDHIIGTFEFFHESGIRIFTYAKIAIPERFSALSYNYTTDSIEPVNSFTEKSAIYIRVINLKKPFPFF